MKKKLLTIGGVILISLLSVGVVFAFYAGNVDGVWGEIDVRIKPPCQEATSLFFSEYVYNESWYWYDAVALEIYNGTGTTVSLNGYSVQLYYSGGGSTTVALNNVNLVDGDVYVLVNADSTGSTTEENQTFPDNDNYATIVLLNGTTVVDVIGSTTTPTTVPSGKQDRTFRRNTDVCSGDIDGDTTYGEWTILLDRDYSDLGTYEGVDELLTEDGATCDNYATGGDDTLGGDPTSIQTSWWNQTPPNTDWNQVRYGVGTYYDSTYACENSPSNDFFGRQSGMGFDGVNGIPAGTDFREAFVLGTFCHYNNPIWASTGGDSNALDYVDLDVTVSGIGCEAPLEPGPSNPTEMTFSYLFNLDETSNSGECAYVTDPPGTPCADAIFISQDPDPAYFTCYSPGTPPVPVEYTVVVLGFMARNTDGTCPDWKAENAVGTFISNEGTSNCACLYGMINDFVPTAVDLLDFTGERSDTGVTLAWQTANEIENLGFNLYRSTSETGTRVKLNAGLIPTNVMPGSLVGASYSYDDLTAISSQPYYYWLEDVEAGGKTTLNGPIVVP